MLLILNLGQLFTLKVIIRENIEILDDVTRKLLGTYWLHDFENVFCRDFTWN